jgi:antirestriction protein ArdC
MKQPTQDIYGIVTDKIITMLDQGVIPWHQPWHGRGVPCNLLTMRPYRGINVLLLNMLGYKQNYFLSFNQIKAIGGSVKKGEKSELIVFWKYLEKKGETETDETESKLRKRVLRYYHVFNIEQCTGIPERLVPQVPQNVNDPITLCEQIVLDMPNRPQIRHFENEAYYVPKDDYINMPDIEYFTKSEAYYATLFHELVHNAANKIMPHGIARGLVSRAFSVRVYGIIFDLF